MIYEEYRELMAKRLKFIYNSILRLREVKGFCIRQ